MENVDKILLLILFTVLGLIILGIFYAKKNKKKFMPAYSGIMFGILLYYIIEPIIIIANIDKMIDLESEMGIWGNNTITGLMVNQPLYYYIYALLMILIVIVFFNVFYSVKYKAKVEKSHEIVLQDKFYKIIIIITYIFFIIGTISLIIFFKSFGSIKNALNYAEYFRSFSNDLSNMIGTNSIFIISAKVITVVPFLSLLIINDKKNIKNKENIVFIKSIFVISNILSILYFLFNAGRAPIIVFALCYLYMFLKKRIKKTWTIIIFLGIILLPILDVLDKVFIYFAKGNIEFDFSYNYLKYIYQFMYPFRNILNLLPMQSLYGINWGKDFIISFLDILPGINFQPSYLNTSIYVNGVNWKILGRNSK